MKNSWLNCKNILVIRPDNMGDVIMLTPALRALKQTFGCRITLLTSQRGSLITPRIIDIDETLVFDVPWVRTGNALAPGACVELVEKLKVYHFDGVIISTVYSQNPLPAAMVAFMADIPLRLAYCRENPYELLTDWIPDKEPYSFIQHQVIRELNLVAHIEARTDNENLSLRFDKFAYQSAVEKLVLKGVDITHPWIIVHPGVSETKREYPLPLWIKAVTRLHEHTGKQILITGSQDEQHITDKIKQASGPGTFSVAGLFTIEEFISLIANTSLVISVNTATVHIAAATNTPVIVLYALTNPQHTPWNVPSVVLSFNILHTLKSKNEVIRYVLKRYTDPVVKYPSASQIVKSAQKLLAQHAEKKEVSKLEEPVSV